MIVIIDTGAANLASVKNALDRLQMPNQISDEKDKIQAATHVILPGVGSAKNVMAYLRKKNLVDVICRLQQPTLGICLGMQLLYTFSDEEQSECLGIIPGTVKRMAGNMGVTVPHMGWNRLRQTQADCPLWENIGDGSYFYYVHSFVGPMDQGVMGVSYHGVDFPAVVNKANFWGVQFHPEKSATAGSQLLRSFVTL